MKNLALSGYEWGKRIPSSTIFIVVIVLLAYFASLDFGQAQYQAKAWMGPVVSQSEGKAVAWAVEQFPPRTIFVTDIFGGELLMSRGLEGVEGGDWAIVPNVVDRMNDVQYKIYGTNSSEEAHSYAKKYGAEYVWLPDRQVFAGFEWKTPEPALFEDTAYFELVYDDGVRIYKVK